MSWLDSEWFTLRVDTPEFWVETDDSDIARNYPPCTYGRTFRIWTDDHGTTPEEVLDYEVALLTNWIRMQIPYNHVPPIDFWVWTASPTPLPKEES